MQAVRHPRYDSREYFWINDMHPVKPELEGQDLSENKDPAGKKLFVAFVDRVKQSGAGFVPFLWPKPGAEEPVGKISYVKGFKPWGWIIGSGVYTDDTAAKVWGTAHETDGGYRPDHARHCRHGGNDREGRNLPCAGPQSAMRAVAEGNKQVDGPARNRTDEPGEMAGAVQAFKQVPIDKEETEARRSRGGCENPPRRAPGRAGEAI